MNQEKKGKEKKGKIEMNGEMRGKWQEVNVIEINYKWMWKQKTIK
jgi:hypothetical protein